MRLVLRVDIDIDEEEYPIPADGDVGEALKEDLITALWDYTGISVRTVKVLDNR